MVHINPKLNTYNLRCTRIILMTHRNLTRLRIKINSSNHNNSIRHNHNHNHSSSSKCHVYSLHSHPHSDCHRPHSSPKISTPQQLQHHPQTSTTPHSPSTHPRPHRPEHRSQQDMRHKHWLHPHLPPYMMTHIPEGSDREQVHRHECDCRVWNGVISMSIGCPGL